MEQLAGTEPQNADYQAGLVQARNASATSNARLDDSRRLPPMKLGGTDDPPVHSRFTCGRYWWCRRRGLVGRHLLTSIAQARRQANGDVSNEDSPNVIAGSVSGANGGGSRTAKP
jgi:hypothetical protein